MDIVNDTPYTFLPFDCTPAPNLPALTLIVKGAFSLQPEGPALALAKAAQPQMKGDELHMDELGRSLSYATDLVAIKTRGEVTVAAVCHTPGGRPRPTCDVSIEIGAIKKTLRVTGDRTWSHGPGGQSVISKVAPFVTMPIRWELAFGGLAMPENPMGRGAEPAPDDAGKMVHALPNVEHVENRVNDFASRPSPAGFGPISPTWDPRRKRLGTRDQRWATFRAPLLPKDFDARAYNAAPDDQQLVEGYFVGDERIVATSLHKDAEVYRTALPGKRLRLLLLIRARPNAEPPMPERFIEVEMKLDTVHVDLEKEELVLVWRRPVKTKHRAHPELEAVYIAEEDLATEPKPLEVHIARFHELRPKRTKPDVEAEMVKQKAEVSRVLREGKVDPAVVEKLEKTKDPKEMFDLLLDHAKEKIRVLEQMTDKYKSGTR